MQTIAIIAAVILVIGALFEFKLSIQRFFAGVGMLATAAVIVVFVLK